MVSKSMTGQPSTANGKETKKSSGFFSGSLRRSNQDREPLVEDLEMGSPVSYIVPVNTEEEHAHLPDNRVRDKEGEVEYDNRTRTVAKKSKPSSNRRDNNSEGEENEESRFGYVDNRSRGTRHYRRHIDNRDREAEESSDEDNNRSDGEGSREGTSRDRRSTADAYGSPAAVKRGHWLDDSMVDDCEICRRSFGFTRRKHHCRYCGHIFCANCSSKSCQLPPEYGYKEAQRVCNSCFNTLVAQQGGAEGARSSLSRASTGHRNAAGHKIQV